MPDKGKKPTTHVRNSRNQKGYEAYGEVKAGPAAVA